MNFAAVFSTATVFLCQNNHYAISLGRATQTRAETIADKAVAYGMPGEQVDGNDLFAVLTATRAAVASARNGAGPTLIEAVTYRMGPHTTSDDPGRYRPAEEVEQWRELDPLERVRLYLVSQDQWDEEWQSELETTASERIERAVDTAEGLDPLPASDPFDRMFASASPPPRRAARRGTLMAVLTLAQAITDALDCALKEDERVILLGEDVGANRRCLPGHRRAHRALWLGAGDRHPGCRVGDRGDRVRYGRRRTSPGRRDPVHGLLLPGVRPGDQPRVTDPQPQPASFQPPRW